MRRFVVLAGLLAGCGRLVDADPDLWPPPETDTAVERGDPGSFDPCPALEVDAPRPLSASAAGTSDPRIAWSQDLRQFMVVWRDGGNLVARRLDEAGVPIRLELVVRGPHDADVTGDPAIVAVPGHPLSPFHVTVRTGTTLGVDRILDTDRHEPQLVPLGGLVASSVLAPDERAPALATDGQRIAIGYRTETLATSLVSLRVEHSGEADCLHDVTEGDDTVCLDSALGGDGPAAIGWLPPAPTNPEGQTEDSLSATSTEPSWLMAVRFGGSLQWVGLAPPADPGGPLVEIFPGLRIGPDVVDGAPRISTGNRRFAVALRRGEVTEAWQVTDSRDVACVLASDRLSAGSPAVAWAHGRRLAVVGLWPRANGSRSVVIARGDAPVTERDRELAAQEGYGCPAPIDLVEVTRSNDARPRDPDVAFSGDALGIVWAQTSDEDRTANVWFARAHCVAP